MKSKKYFKIQQRISIFLTILLILISLNQHYITLNTIETLRIYFSDFFHILTFLAPIFTFFIATNIIISEIIEFEDKHRDNRDVDFVHFILAQLIFLIILAAICFGLSTFIESWKLHLALNLSLSLLFLSWDYSMFYTFKNLPAKQKVIRSGTIYTNLPATITAILIILISYFLYQANTDEKIISTFVMGFIAVSLIESTIVYILKNESPLFLKLIRLNIDGEK